MKIANAQISMQAMHQRVEKHYEEVRLTTRTGNQRPEVVGRGMPNGNGVQLALSPQAQAVQPQRMMQNLDEAEDIAPEEQVKMLILSRIYEQVTGRSLEITTADEIVDHDKVSQTMPAEQQPQRSSANIEFDYYSSHYEYEKSHFSAEGVIQTADGKQIDFSVELTMSREYIERQRLSIRGAEAEVKDPLVINYAGKAAELTENKYSFDLDADGRQEQISFVRPGSGFLVADLNSDGVVNDGRELFGPRSGDGFSELAQHDDDANGWIDEADSIYDSLRIWSKQEDGNDRLIALGSVGVGAIYLGNLDTPFEHKDKQNQLQAEVVKTGIFVTEQGEVGTVQQLNLVV